MNGRALLWGLFAISSAGIAQGQVPKAEPSAPAPASAQPAPVDAPPEPTEPPVAETPPAVEPPVEPQPEPPRPRVRWTEPSGEPEEQGELQAYSAEKGEEAEPGLEETREHRATWKLQGAHFILAVERITSILAWSDVTSSTGSDAELEASGTEVAFLGAGPGRAVSGVPRVAFDAVLDVGFSIGGSLSYVASTGGKETLRGGGSEVDESNELDDRSVSIVAPRLGGLLTPLPNIGVWLRGGITHIGLTETGTLINASGSSQEVEVSASLWQLSLDPQLVVVPAPRVAITLAVIMDIGLPSSAENQVGGESLFNKTDRKNSSYGISAGLAAIF